MNTKKIMIIALVLIVLGSVVYFVFYGRATKTDQTLGKIIQQKALNIENDTVTLADESSYFISFSITQQNFDIILTPQSNALAQTARQAAETALLRILEIGKSQACNLSVNQTVAQSYSLELSGKNYGLSFCPGSKEIANVQ